MSFQHCFDTREIPILCPFPTISLNGNSPFRIWHSSIWPLVQGLLHPPDGNSNPDGTRPRSRLLPLPPPSLRMWAPRHYPLPVYCKRDCTCSSNVNDQMRTVPRWTGSPYVAKEIFFFDITIASDIDIQDLRYLIEPNFGCLRVSNTKHHSRYQISACWCFACVLCCVIIVFFVVDRILKYELHTYLSSALILSLSRSK